MTRATKKLTGPSLHRFFRRLFRAQAGLDSNLADRLASASSRTFSSVRVRRIAWTNLKQATAALPVAVPEAPAPAPEQAPQTIATAAVPPPTFDPYAFGLVPIFQREGRDALLSQLATVESPDNLRRMAKAQQIALPADLRTGAVPLETLRCAIADAVQKRISNRRAAAG